MNEEQLLHLASTRGDKTLWENLKEHSSVFQELVDRLTDLLRQVDFISPFSLYSEILFMHKGLQKIMERFGPEAMDPLEEFLGLAYHYHHQSPASLQGFLHWLRQGRLEIKRDFSQTECGEVRIMTVHGAKGLQAPVVILADTVSRPTLKQHFLWHEDRACLWSPSQDLDTKVTQQLKQQIRTLQDQEYRRLLYVALTRAEDQLYICGAHESQRDIKGSWYHLVESALSSQATKISLPWGEGLRLENLQEVPPSLPSAPSEDQTQKEEAGTTPAWLFTAITEEKDAFSKTAVTQQAQGQDASPSLLKGRLIHDLLEILPSLSPEIQIQRIRSYQQGWQEAPEIFEEAVNTVQNILTEKTFERLFQGNSRAEVPLIGYDQGKLYTARLDRLVVFEDEVWIIDYKTDASPPADPRHIDLRYKNQLRLYKELAQQLYPRHQLKTMILWTETRHLMEI